MAKPLVMSCSRSYPVTVDEGFEAVIHTPLVGLFDRRYGPLPSIRAVEGQDGVWGTVGQTRTVRLTGGGSMHEELLTVEAPSRFTYVLSNVTGAMKPLASHIDGLWSFDPVGTGVRITWQWTLHPASALVGPVLPAFRRLWSGYARQTLARIEDLLVSG
jgi:hypothetical protein